MREAKRRGRRAGRRNRIDTSRLESRFERALSNGENPETVYAEWIAEGRRLLAERKGFERSLVIRGLHAIDNVYTRVIEAGAAA